MRSRTRAPRYAPDTLERRLSPSVGMPGGMPAAPCEVSAEASGAPEAPPDPPEPAEPPDAVSPTLPPFEVGDPPISEPTSPVGPYMPA